MEKIMLMATSVYFALIMLVNIRVLLSKNNYIELTYSSPLFTMLILIIYWTMALEREINAIIVAIAFGVTLIVIFYRYINRIRTFTIYNIKSPYEKDVMNFISDTVVKDKGAKENIIFKKSGIKYKMVFKNYNDDVIQTCMKEIHKYQEDNKKIYILPILLIFISGVLLIVFLRQLF